MTALLVFSLDWPRQMWLDERLFIFPTNVLPIFGCNIYLELMAWYSSLCMEPHRKGGEVGRRRFKDPKKEAPSRKMSMDSDSHLSDRAARRLRSSESQ